MRRVTWAFSALQDFEDAIFYIAKKDPRAAMGVADRIDQAATLLGQSPIGRYGRVSGTYEKSIARTPYIIAYALTDDAVTILRVIHSRRDWRDEEWPK